MEYMQLLSAIFGLLVCVLVNVIHSNSNDGKPSNRTGANLLNIVASSVDGYYCCFCILHNNGQKANEWRRFAKNYYTTAIIVTLPVT